MKKNISRNPLWPDWYNGKKIDEVQFGRAFLEQWPLKCVNGTLYTLDGPVEDESEIKQRILENIEEYVTSGLSKKVTNILETIKLLAFSDPFPIEQDCIHLQNGVYHLPDGTFQESRLFCQNRLPVKYDPKAPTPDRWLTFLHELLDDADIPTLQEYLGYCLIPSTKGQKMMLIVGKGGEGKSRIGLVLKRLMGDAASNGSVQKVENNRFARADLERRLLMIDDDMDMNALPKTNYIKTIHIERTGSCIVFHHCVLQTLVVWLRSMTRYRSFVSSTGAFVIVPEENEKSEPFSNRKQVRIFLVWWARVDSNHRS
ncbi:DUF5906 domain-containing protein [Faecalibacterium sp.]|uniref:DUF5906 domain-containing protein n=1 Tax=Faecalibacterium sp. TaxID=1971605 RepID=UPI0035274A12